MAKPDSALTLTKRRHVSWETMLVVVLVLGVILGRVLSPMFLSSANLSNMLADFTEIALIALPMTLIIVAAEIDLSVASVLGASSALMGVLWHMGLPMPLVIAIVLVAGTLAGLFNGLVIVRFNLPSLAVTIGTLALFRGLAAVLLGGVSIFGGRGSMFGVLLSLLIIGVLRNALTLSDVSSETLTIVTGGLLLSSVLIPNLVARWRVMREKRLMTQTLI